MRRKMKKIFSVVITIIIILCIPLALPACETGGGGKKPMENYSVYPPKDSVVSDRQYYTEGEVQYPSTLWVNSVYSRAEKYDYTFYGVSAYFIRGVNYGGVSTEFFAYAGFPDNASAKNPVPGMVLVHGGGGTAFADWVQYWVRQGYAAVSIDVEGNMPVLPGATTTTTGNKEKSSRNHGPARQGSWMDSALEVESQWMYHAIADVIAAVTFLADFSIVDASKIGCQGVSWGSVIVSAVAQYDDRLAFVVPIYGSIGLSGTRSHEGIAIDLRPRAVELWDNLNGLKNCRTPFLFINGQSDISFSVQVQANCGSVLKNKEYVIIDNLRHNHGQCMSVPEIVVFCNNICFGFKKSLPQIIKQPEEGGLTVKFGTERDNVIDGMLYCTSESDIVASMSWNVSAVDIEEGTTEFSLASTVKWAFLTFTDITGTRASTKLISIGN